MNKKGFTLVELLAVIIVLAILVLLALPRVMSLMERSRVSSFAVEANEIAKAATNAYGSRVLTEEEVGHPVCFTVAELVSGGYLDAEKNDINGAIAIDLVPDENDLSKTNEIVYTYLSKENYYVKKNGVAGNNKVANSDVVKSKGGSLFSDCTTTCSATTGGEIIMCGDTNIASLTPSLNDDTLPDCEYELGHAWSFDYKGSIDEFSIPCEGNYMLEVWGAQGGSYSEAYHGGYGGYATGFIRLNTTDKLYIGVGGAGTHIGNYNTGSGGYNGGGNITGTWSDGNERRSTGGGATHIAKNNNLGVLKNYVDNQSDILIVAGGGGGGHANNTMVTSSSYAGGYGIGGSGGGTNGGNSIGQQYNDLVSSAGGTSSQTPSETRGSFGQGGQAKVGETNYGIHDGGGAGWYGGERNWRGAAGGSGYVSSSLSNSHMTCFNCMSTEDSVTTNVTTVSATAMSNAAKKGNGYAKITYVGNKTTPVNNNYQFAYTGTVQTFTAPKSGTYKLEAWGAQGGSFDSTYYGGYGGYSTGNINLNSGDKLYIAVGRGGSVCVNGRQSTACEAPASFNGGGACSTLTGYNTTFGSIACGAGGGASHIATASGVLSELSTNRSAILLVAGGGGGTKLSNAPSNYGAGGAGGGFNGNANISMGNDLKTAVYGTQESGASAFGLGINGGGGGFYGGGGSLAGGGGGSGYINTSRLSSAKMVCFNCTTSTTAATKTETSTCHNAAPTSNCAKDGDGYVIITYLNS